MIIDILTLFPEMFEPLKTSLIGRATEKSALKINLHNIRDFSKNKHKKCDDYPFGGGPGMLMTPQPIFDAIESIDGYEDAYKIYMSPKGNVFNQSVVPVLASHEHIIILCGHYEGVDQRVLDEIVDMEVSLGDFVLTGGEIAAMAVIDAAARLIPGVLANEGSYSNESHFNGLLEHPQYTRPYEWNGKMVPEVLISGHHANIEKWKREQSLLNTAKKRPDMLKKAELTKEDKKILQKLGI